MEYRLVQRGHQGMAWLVLTVAMLGLTTMACAAEPVPTDTIVLAPMRIIITANDAAAIDTTFNANIAVYGTDLGRPLDATGFLELCNDWASVGWDYDRIPASTFTAHHGELPVAIRQVTGWPNTEPINDAVAQYCAFK